MLLSYKGIRIGVSQKNRLSHLKKPLNTEEAEVEENDPEEDSEETQITEAGAEQQNLLN